MNGSIFVKTHLAALLVSDTPTINMGVTRGAAYIVRNPLDVACSFAPHMGHSLDETIAVMETVGYCMVNPRSVLELISSWSQNVESWTGEPNPAVHVMRYEDMLAEPIATFGGFVRHTGLKPTPSQLRQAIRLSAIDKLRSQEGTGDFKKMTPLATGPFFDQGRSGRWRETLSKAQVERIVSAHKRQMARFGYLDGL